MEKKAAKATSKKTLKDNEKNITDDKIKRNKKDFLVVGLGASAGGIKALQEFFATMPPNSDMAFVVILHLAPKHESNLAEILQAQTTMPIVKVSETLKVVPNHVYVVQPNRRLEMTDGVIRSLPIDQQQGNRVTIDNFFRTLAEAHQRNAVGVVLSGTGADGTLGLKRIKESNGFAIVQEPADAEYDQMPRSAISTGLIDWVLPIKLMPEKLINFRESSERLHLTDGDAAKVAEEINAEESLREILTILRVRTGHDFSNYKMPTLIRRIARHLQIHELEDIPTYLNFLRDNQEEIQSLQRNLLVNVTNFFRDREAFAELETEVIPKLFSGKNARDTVRVWCAGCASGEEAYSLAMLLSEYAEKLTDPPKFQVFATDVDDEAIIQAREHIYPNTIEADVSPERLRRYFVAEGSRYRVKKELREAVLFAPHNILRAPPFSRLDLITCRNVLIYINRDTQSRIMEIFHFALNREGFLFLGTSESAENASELFEATNKKNRIYRRRSTLMHQAQPKMPVVSNWQLNASEIKPFARRTRAFSLGEVHYKLLENLAPPSALVDHEFEVIYTSESLGRYLRFSGGEPTNNLLKLVKPDLQPDLRAALFAAQRERKSSEFPNVRVTIDGVETFVKISVRAVDVEDAAKDFLLVIFDESAETKPPRPDETQAADRKAIASHGNKDDAMIKIVERLEDELRRTRTSLRATIEQHEIAIEELKASNEELQAINEELRSATEELETSKEESQSMNEELTTVNAELKENIDETNRVNSDLKNLISSTDIATIFLDRRLCIKRYAPLAERLFNIKETDIGRPIEHFTHNLAYENLTADAEQALLTLKTFEREISDKKNNRHFLTRFAPYRTLDDRIEGVVLNFIDVTESRRANEIVRQSEQRFRAVANLVSVLMWSNDLNGATHWYNERWFEYTGQTFEEAAGFGWADAIHPDDRDDFRRNFQTAIDEGTPLRQKHRLRRADGEYRWFLVQTQPVYDENGKIEQWFSAATDIHEQRTALEDARESKERLRIAAEAAELGIWEWNLVTDEVIWDERQFALLGLKPRQKAVSPDEFFNYVHTDDRERVAGEARKAIEEKSVFDSEFCILHKDGKTRWMKGFGRLIEQGADGKPLRMSGVMFDITERKTAQESMRESEEQLRLILESTKDYAIITYDLDGRITRWNAGAEKIFGFTEQEAVGQMTNFIFTPEDIAKKEPEKELGTALKNGRAEDERWHVRKDGTRFFASGVMQPLRDGITQGFVKICRDETERMKAETAMQEKEMLRRLVAGQEDERRRIARDIHDHLGQQLTALRLKLALVRKMCDGEQQICAEIEQAQASAAQIDADVDFIAWELRPVALDDLGLRVTLDNFVREWARHSNVKAEFHVTNFGKMQLNYETQTNLYRIAQEALNNIYKHSKAKNVSVLLEKRKDKILLIIEDDGAGFETKNRKVRNKGIGLAGMRERAEFLGGELEIESSPGSGTTIFVRVPVRLQPDTED